MEAAEGRRATAGPEHRPGPIERLYACIGQTAAHPRGTGPRQVLVRASFWVVQLGLFVWKLIRLVA